MSKRIYLLAIGLITAMSVYDSQSLLDEATSLAGDSIHDRIALVLCNPAQMYSYGLGNPMNVYSYCMLAVLIFSGVFVYSRSYAYPKGFRTLSIFRFGSERAYWRYAMWHNVKNVLFAATTYLVFILGLCKIALIHGDVQTVRFVPYEPSASVYVLFWLKLVLFLFLITIFAEAFAGRMSRQSLLGGITIAICMLMSVDLLQGQLFILVIGNWFAALKVMAGMVLLSLALILYGNIRHLCL